MRSLLPVSQPVSRASSPSASLSRREDYLDIPFHDPNQDNLVAVVSLTSPRIFQPTTKPRLHPSGRTLRIIAISIIRYDPKPYDGVFVLNGPGDPAMLTITIATLSRVMQKGDRPTFDTPPVGWVELLKNANDGSNEGIYYENKPFFLQFRPESTPRPRDTKILFDVFIQSIEECISSNSLVPISLPGGRKKENEKCNPRTKVQKVLILGSGGLSIGQAGELNYSGSQAIKALEEEGIYTILVNPNIATIATSKGLADKPDGIYVTFGGQTALNVGIKLKDEFTALGVRVLGTPIETIIAADDRQLFAQAMESIRERCAQSSTITTTDEAIAAARDTGFPVIVRAAYARPLAWDRVSPKMRLSYVPCVARRSQLALKSSRRVNARLKVFCTGLESYWIPLAFIAAKLGRGVPLNEIKNSTTKVTSTCFEPSLDYVVVSLGPQKVQSCQPSPDQ
ncbi:hypothetical protein JVT61DRAFT_12311 [Boletus reticuloceps]|uniref:Uncharacterized protein n=1 Tax=Boletus reticuloceps TaxID=495285 RepID=A0A8I2YE01_9AGAM|nr:hypothetical protein JVT61DRAFT_12311 [Boletus reticuloceps]